MTVAVHWEPFRVPLGEVAVVGGQLVAYAEKPVHDVLISSGAYVVEPGVGALLTAGQPCNVPELVSLVADAGGKTAAYQHASLWIDVNDATDLRRCEALVHDHPDAFERWQSEPDRHVLNLLLRAGSTVMVARPSHEDCEVWGLPSADCRGSKPSGGEVRRLWERCGQREDPPRPVKLTSFDEVDLTGGTLIRRHIVDAHVADGTAAVAVGGTCRWVRADAPGRVLLSSVVERVLAHVGELT